MSAATQKLTFAEHIQEVRKRLMWSLLFVALGAGIGYALHPTILKLLQQPLDDSLYYTTPTGAFSFVIKVCCVFGFIVALPVVVYQIFAFFGPLLPKKTKRSIVGYVFVSVLLAAAGIAFAYYVSLPAALHFLVNFGSDGADIKAIITADEYFNFVLAYIAGFAVLFQLPLVISFINRVTPLKPSQLMGGTRYVILGSFVVAAVITPTPDPMNQALMAGPIILLYFISVAVVTVMNMRRRSKAKSAALPQMVQATPSETVLADVESLREEPAFSKPAPELRPEPVPAVAVRPGNVNRPVARRLVSDMVVPAQRPHTVPARPAPVQPAKLPVSSTRSAQRQNANLRMGVISDFTPASD